MGEKKGAGRRESNLWLAGFALLALFARQSAGLTSEETVAAAALLPNYEPMHELVREHNAQIDCCRQGEPKNSSRASGQAGGVAVKIMAVQPSVFYADEGTLFVPQEFSLAVFANATITKPQFVTGDDCKTEKTLLTVKAGVRASAVDSRGRVQASRKSETLLNFNTDYDSLQEFALNWPPTGRLDFDLKPGLEPARELKLEANFTLESEYLVRHWKMVKHVFCGGWACSSSWVCEPVSEERAAFIQNAVDLQKAVQYSSAPNVEAVSGKLGGTQVLRVKANYLAPLDSLQVETGGRNFSVHRANYPLSVENQPYNFTRVNAVKILEKEGGVRGSVFENGSLLRIGLPHGGNAASVQVKISTPFGKKSLSLSPLRAAEIALNASAFPRRAKAGERVRLQASVSAEGLPAEGKRVLFYFGNESAEAYSNASGVAQAEFSTPKASTAFFKVVTETELGEAHSSGAVQAENSEKEKLAQAGFLSAGLGVMALGVCLVVGARELASRALSAFLKLGFCLLLAYAVFTVLV